MLLLCNHFSRQASSVLTTVLISSIMSEENDIAVSPAYIVACALLRENIHYLYKAKIKEVPGRILALLLYLMLFYLK